MLTGLFHWKHSHGAIPEQWNGRKIVELPLLAVDLELNSLEASSAEILSIAWISAQANKIDLRSSRYAVSDTDIALNQSPIIHGITAETLSNGEGLSGYLRDLAAKADTHILVFHNVELDVRVLTRHWHTLGLKPKLCCIDTMCLQLYVLRKRYELIPQGLATLSASCGYYHLPEFNAHHALDDAHATLLLLYAQIHHLDYEQKLCLNDIRHTRALRFF